MKFAIESGFRHIDTAAVYGNEISVGEGIRQSGIPREELFVTSKLWTTDRGYEKAMAAFQRSLDDMQLDYLDLYLIHWPAGPHQFDNWKELNLDTWKALVDLYKAGRVHAIGVSNFLPYHLKPMLESEIKPMVNQIEFHPGLMQQDVLDICRAHDILVQAYQPLANGKILEFEELNRIAIKYGRTTPQLCLRWILQHGVLPLSKSVTPSRIWENFQVFDFKINDEDMKIIDAFAGCGRNGSHPDTITF